MDNSSASQNVGQLAAGAMQPRFDRSRGTIQNLADFGARQFLLIEQDKTRAVVFPELLQSALKFLAQFAVFGRGPTLRCFDDVRNGRQPGPLFQSRPAAIDGNRHQPRNEGATSVPTPQVAEYPEENLLRHILGIFPVPQHAITQPENPALKPLHKRAHRSLVTLDAALNKCGISAGHECLKSGFGLTTADRQHGSGLPVPEDLPSTGISGFRIFRAFREMCCDVHRMSPGMTGCPANAHVLDWMHSRAI